MVSSKVVHVGKYLTVSLHLQRRRMPPLIHPVRMVHTLSSHHHLDAGELLTAIFTGVFGLFGTFVQLVAAFVATVRMVCTGGGG